ncbi:MAG: acyl-ACP--UDP-N-acetylglucosamine O-acyltransferase [Candidatus Muiribacteriota bacterium]
MNQIDNRAIIEQGAVIGENCIIEPNVFIGKNVRIGNNVKIMANAYIAGNTTIGDNCSIFPSAVIGTVTQALNFKGGDSGVIIGNNNTIREFATINATEGGEENYTKLGNNNLIMAYTHVAHHCILGNRVILSNAVNLAGHVTLGDNVIIGGLAALHQFVKVGKFTIIGGKSKVVKDVPPYLKVDGNPARVIGLNTVAFQRNNFSAEKKQTIKNIFRELYRKGKNVSQAISVIEAFNNEVSEEYIQFIKQADRGILLKTSAFD